MSEKFQKQIKIFFFVLLLGVIFLVAFEISGKEKLSRPQEAEIFFLDVGQGDAILIQEGRTQILIDGGDGEDILNRLGEVMPFGDRELEIVINTHSDDDHLGGLIKVMENYEIGGMLHTGILCNREICKKRDKIIEDKNIKVLIARLGQEIRVGEDIDLKIVYPFMDLEGKEFKDANDTSVVIRAAIGESSCLLTGDISSDIEDELISNNLDLDVDVLKVGHHGSKNSTSAGFLQAVSPEKSIISVGENSYGHPTEEVINRLLNMNIEIFRTDEMGNIVF